MIELLRKIPWRRLLLLGAGAVVSYLLVPVIISRYNDIRSLRDLRLTRAVEFGSRNNEFTSKVNVTATMLRMFASHNNRMKVSGQQFQEARK